MRDTSTSREHLERALAAERIGEVDLWLGYGSQSRHVAQVAEVLHPHAFIPHHWGGFGVFFEGVNRPFRNANLSAVLQDAGIELLVLLPRE